MSMKRRTPIDRRILHWLAAKLSVLGRVLRPVALPGVSSRGLLRHRLREGCKIASTRAGRLFKRKLVETMWRKNESQSTAPSASSGRALETPSASKVSTNSGGATAGAAVPASWLAPTMRLKGEISGNEDLLVDGKVEGPISVGQHRLIVGRNGQVTGGLAALEIIIYGKVDGNCSVVSESIEIKKNASVIGELTTQRIVIEDGASFKGSIEIEKSQKQVDSKLDNSFLVRAASKSA